MKITLFYDHVTVLDYAYLDERQGLVGDSFIVNVEFTGEADEEGILYDFSHAKKKVKETIDRECDHRLVISQDVLKNATFSSEGISLKYQRELHYSAPEQAYCLIPSSSHHIPREELESFLEKAILKEIRGPLPHISSVKISLTREPLEEHRPLFHYTHGLKKHRGNCQRLFHGHRNTLEVHVNGRPHRDLEQWLVHDNIGLDPIHFCLFENVVDEDKEELRKATGQKTPEGRFFNLPPVHIEYQSGQGIFRATLPGRGVYFLQEESTVENLSSHFAKAIKSKVGPRDTVCVHAFEGIGKGAITTL